MDNQSKTVTDKKEQLLSQLKKIQSKIDNLENQRYIKINKLAKKHKLLDLSDDIIEAEFMLMKEKYACDTNEPVVEDSVKKN